MGDRKGHARNTNTMTVELIDTPTGRNIEVRVTGTAGHVHSASVHDRADHRVVIAILEESPGAPDRETVIEFPITISEGGERHSLTALVVVGTSIMAQDRKKIRSGRTEG